MSSMGIGLTTVTKDRTQLAVTAEGLISQNWMRGLGSGATALTSGQVQYNLIGFRAGDTITNLVTYMTVTGVQGGTGAAFMGLYDKAGTRLALTADQTTAFTGSASIAIVCPLTASYTITADDGYYIALFSNFATTQPTIWRGSSTGGSGAQVGSGARPMAQQSGQASLPSPSATFSNSSLSFWVAAS
jgi:hypothetical protein